MNGHDHAKYLGLLEEAVHFQIPSLETWLRDKQYLPAVKVEYSAVEIEDVLQIDDKILPDTEVSFKTT